MKTIFLIVVILGLAFGCATGPPVKNPQFKESSLPMQSGIDGIEPIKNETNGWEACINMILNFYGRSAPDGDAKIKAMGGAALLFVTQPLPTSIIMGVDYYKDKMKMHGFKYHQFYNQSPNGTKIKYFLAQGHPVIVGRRVVTTTGFQGSSILLTGYDDSRDIFSVCDPALGEAVEMSYKEFMECVPMIRPWADESKTMRLGTIIYPKN
jgi:hypothetical protein